MNERRIKGMNIAQTAAFLNERLSASQRDAVYALLSEPLKAKLKNVDTSEWYPVEDQVAIQRAMAEVLGSNEVAEAKIRELGGYLFSAALGTFMRLVLRVLTPAMFLKKTGDIWPRMFDFGSFEADPSTMSDGKATMIMRGVDGCDWFPAVSAGFIEEAMKAMNYANVTVDYAPMAEEPEGTFRFIVTWAKS